MLFKATSLTALAAVAVGMPVAPSYPTSAPLTSSPLPDTTDAATLTEVPVTFASFSSGTEVTVTTKGVSYITPGLYGRIPTTASGSDDTTVPTSWKSTVTVYAGETTAGWTDSPTATQTSPSTYPTSSLL
ncbi:hypothetical protein Hte_002942 [Hypoxylon texense]